MTSDATFQNQLQALATATANFANDTNAQIKNTIINALGGSQQSGGLLDPHLRTENGIITWDGNGTCSRTAGLETGDPVTKGSPESSGFFLLDSDGTYAKDWLAGSIEVPPG